MTMWRKARPIVLGVSIALNIAVLSMWAAYALPTHLRGLHGAGHGEGVWCPLHRQLGATQAQWREIEPRFLEFQKSAQTICEEVNRARVEMIDLLAAPEPDRESIRAKQAEILAGQGRMQEMVIKHLLSEKAVLTPAQADKLFEMLRRQSGCAGHGPMMGWMGRAPLHSVNGTGAGKKDP
jgi:Spy/CpxP family protein refolding chaperone